MKKLKFLEAFKITKCETIYHHRAFVVTDIPDRVFVEQKTVFPNGHMYCKWYCPTIEVYKSYKKDIKYRLGGCAGLGYWFDLYGKNKP